MNCSDNDAVFLNYDAADRLVKASRPRLAQALRLVYVLIVLHHCYTKYMKSYFNLNYITF